MVSATVFSLKTICALLLVTIGIAESAGHAKYRTDTRRWVDKSILCYECNSEYDPRCGDPFNNYTIGIVNCSLKRIPEHIDEPPTLCRKTVQTVNGKIRVIRACGYVPSDKDDKECVKRSGTHDVQVRYCSCTGSLCNKGLMDRLPSTCLISIAIGVLGIILYKL